MGQQHLLIIQFGSSILLLEQPRVIGGITPGSSVESGCSLLLLPSGPITLLDTLLTATVDPQLTEGRVNRSLLGLEVEGGTSVICCEGDDVVHG